jgi:predicted nuclease of predicted toxin-antitoxin system
MKFLLDENAEFRLVAFLVERGHDVTSIAHDYPGGLADHEVLAIARRESRIVITNDRDFGELIVRRRLAHAGVIFFRLRTQDPQAKLDHLADVLADYSAQLDQFLVVTERRVRIREWRASDRGKP